MHSKIYLSKRKQLLITREIAKRLVAHVVCTTWLPGDSSNGTERISTFFNIKIVL